MLNGPASCQPEPGHRPGPPVRSSDRWLHLFREPDVSPGLGRIAVPVGNPPFAVRAAEYGGDRSV